MKTLTLTFLTVLGLSTPAIAFPAPQDLNLTIPSAQSSSVPTPLIWNWRRAEIEALAVNAIRNGVEPGFIRAEIIRGEAIKSPTRTYKYIELDRLVDSIYSNARNKAGSGAIAGGLR